MKVINEAKKSSNKRKTADANSIDHKFVRNWMNQKSQIKEELSKYYLRGETIDQKKALTGNTIQGRILIKEIR